MLREALRLSTDAAPQLGYIVAVPRATKRPRLLRSIQIDSGQNDGKPSTATLVILDLDDCPQPGEELLQHLFGLAPAECRVARRLSCGEELSSIARSLGTSVATVRIQLKAIFWKTGTRRQAELVAILSHIARLAL